MKKNVYRNGSAMSVMWLKEQVLSRSTIAAKSSSRSIVINNGVMCGRLVLCAAFSGFIRFLRKHPFFDGILRAL
jgi:hypothetical protein